MWIDRRTPSCGGSTEAKHDAKEISMRPLATLLLIGATLAGCQTSPPPPTGTVDTHEAMVRWINPAALTIWDVSNTAMGETGGLDPALMDDERWSKLQNAAQLLELRSRHMAEAQVLRVGAHNDATEGFATRAEIQAMIDADPERFKRMSEDMAEHAKELAAAAVARDIRQSGGLADSLFERCQACHSRYWEKPVQ
jgi:hypothetical protein